MYRWKVKNYKDIYINTALDKRMDIMTMKSQGKNARISVPNRIVFPYYGCLIGYKKYLDYLEEIHTNV